MDNANDKKRIISNEEARKILQDNGLDTSPEETSQLLDFLYLFAVFSLKYINNHNDENSRFVHKG